VRFGKLLFERNRDRTLDEISSLEGTVSKRKDSPYRSGRSSDWLKMKNSDAPGREARSGGGLGQEEEVMNADQHRDIYIIFAAAIVFVLVATVFALWVAWR
jgi:hypothetical protein